MTLFLAAALLPGLYWDRGVETIPALRKAGVTCVYVPADQSAAWQKAGFCHQVDTAKREKLASPGIRMEYNQASATRAPWVDAHGWRFERRPAGAYLYELKAGAAELAAAEACAYRANALLRIEAGDLEAYGRMLAFLARTEADPLPARANLGVIDDGSDVAGEVMNLLARRNLLFRIVPAPDPQLDLNVRMGPDAADPSAFAYKIRRQLTDEKRLLRIYGSEVVLGRLTGDARKARLHLLNYARAKIEGLRVRVIGAYRTGTVAAAGYPSAGLADYTVTGNATEFRDRKSVV